MKPKYYLYIAIWITIFMTWFLVSGLLSSDTPKSSDSTPQKPPPATYAGVVSDDQLEADRSNTELGYLHLDGEDMAVALDRDAEPELLAAINERDEATKEKLVTSGKAINIPDGTSVIRLGASGHILVHLQIVGGIHGNEEVYAPVAWYKKKS